MVIHAKLFLLFCAVKYVKFGMGQLQLHKIHWYIPSKKLIEFAALLIYYKQYKYPEFRNQRFFFQPSQILLRPATPLPYRGWAPPRTEMLTIIVYFASPAAVRTTERTTAADPKRIPQTPQTRLTLKTRELKRNRMRRCPPVRVSAVRWWT